jgi:hypothetical protein
MGVKQYLLVAADWPFPSDECLGLAHLLIIFGKMSIQGWAQRHTPVISDAQEAEAGGSSIQGKLGKVNETLSHKQNTKPKGWGTWLSGRAITWHV